MYVSFFLIVEKTFTIITITSTTALVQPAFPNDVLMMLCDFLNDFFFFFVHDETSQCWTRQQNTNHCCE
jgi:hypothetical protein